MNEDALQDHDRPVNNEIYDSSAFARSRADELRTALIREVMRAMAIAMQAQAAFLDADDELALSHLRHHWTTVRGNVAPLAAELSVLLNVAKTLDLVAGP